MHTISMLRRTLGLSSDNQVRNRMERIKNLLAEHIRRGPNNQIFLTEPGLELMRKFQELCDTGLTLAEASQVLRASSYSSPLPDASVSPRSALNETKPKETGSDGATAQTSGLIEEMALIRTHLAALQQQLPSSRNEGDPSADTRPWWTYLREDVDVT
jgi:hypothetical protein